MSDGSCIFAASGRAACAIGLVCAALFVAAPGAALAQRCPPATVLPRISLTSDPGTIAYLTDLGRQGLQRVQRKAGGSRSRPGWHAVGLTVTDLQFRMSISVNTLSRGDGRYCATVGRVDASLGYDTISVFIDNRYRRGSCQYLSVVEHENAHVAVFRDTLALYAPKVERRLTDAASRLKPVAARSAKRAADKLQRALQREMEPLFKEMNRVLDAANDRLDTTANYQREQDKCSKW